MATLLPRHVRVSEVVSKLLEPATTSFFQVMISDPRQLGDTPDAFTAYLREQGVSNLTNGGLSAPKRDKLMLFCCETALPGSNLMTTELMNDFTGVTERHVHRRAFDDRIDLTFYCDAREYLAIRYFEAWMSYITNERGDTHSETYHYKMRFPNMYKGSLEVTKFEKNTYAPGAVSVKPLTYTFINAFPISIASMPVSYDSSSLLKCTVSFTYSRYSSKPRSANAGDPVMNPLGQARFNIGEFAGNLTDRVVDNLTGNDLLGDIAGGIVQNLF